MQITCLPTDTCLSTSFPSYTDDTSATVIRATLNDVEIYSNFKWTLAEQTSYGFWSFESWEARMSVVLVQRFDIVFITLSCQFMTWKLTTLSYWRLSGLFMCTFVSDITVISASAALQVRSTMSDLRAIVVASLLSSCHWYGVARDVLIVGDVTTRHWFVVIDAQMRQVRLLWCQGRPGKNKPSMKRHLLAIREAST